MKARAKIIFVTGTDTGVGKTVLTALLLEGLRAEGRNALALKPFCSGSRADARALLAREKGCLTLDEVNPFYFDKALAPRAAAPPGRLPSLKAVVKYIEDVADRCDLLLVEGSGGLLVPLGVDFTVADLIRELSCAVIVVSCNKLGTINHTLLTVSYLERVGIKHVSVALMRARHTDLSARSNLRILREMAPGTRLIEVPFLTGKPLSKRGMKKSVTFLKKTLAEIMDNAIVSLPARKGRG